MVQYQILNVMDVHALFYFFCFFTYTYIYLYKMKPLLKENSSIKVDLNILFVTVRR